MIGNSSPAHPATPGIGHRPEPPTQPLKTAKGYRGRPNPDKSRVALLWVWGHPNPVAALGEPGPVRASLIWGDLEGYENSDKFASFVLPVAWIERRPSDFVTLL